MAKYFDLGIADAPMTAGADLSASANQYRFVGSGSAAATLQVELATGASLPAPFGVLQNSPCAAEEAQVRTLGFSKLRVDTAQGGDTTGASPIQVWDFLTSTSIGYGRKAGGAASPVLARAMEAVASGSAIIHVQLLLSGANAAAAS